MKLCVLASGSGGNVTYLESKGTKILLDCGITYKQISLRLNSKELSLENLDGILVTHEHTDHVKGINVLLKRHKSVCYLTESTHNSLYFKVKENIKEDQLSFITPNESFTIKNIEVLPISISHDAEDAVGYIIYAEGKKVVYITDIGYLPAKDIEVLKNADIYVFESNYDITMLFTSERPFYLKQRIDSVKGHMSNNDSAYNMTKLIGENTKQIILAHPSRECNSKEVAIKTYDEVFKDYDLKITDYNLVVASQDVPTKVFEI